MYRSSVCNRSNDRIVSAQCELKSFSAVVEHRRESVVDHLRVEVLQNKRPKCALISTKFKSESHSLSNISVRLQALYWKSNVAAKAWRLPDNGTKRRARLFRWLHGQWLSMSELNEMLWSPMPDMSKTGKFRQDFGHPITTDSMQFDSDQLGESSSTKGHASLDDGVVQWSRLSTNGICDWSSIAHRIQNESTQNGSLVSPTASGFYTPFIESQHTSLDWVSICRL